ncbi:MAG: hypothetical protein ACKOEO_09660 [Planctomycetaceae bacterium]
MSVSGIDLLEHRAQRGCEQRRSAGATRPALLLLLAITASLSQFPEKLARADDLPGLHNVREVAPNLLVGGEPEGEAAFAALQKKGITTIVSVDGALPDIQLAAKYGLRYVHIPLGYDGIDQRSQLALVRVARDIQTPIYVHCHHGRHRGPAAAAVICQATGQLNSAQATELLKRCGTSPDYRGLWRDVAAFKTPDPNTVLPELHAQAKVDSLAAAMAKLDRHFENVKLAATAGWKTPPDHPDLVPQTELLLLHEGLSESLRLLTSDRPAEFQQQLRESERQSKDLLQAVKTGRTEDATKLLMQLTAGCTKCHQQFRN